MKKIPMRRCLATNESFPKKELLRIVRTPEGEVKVDGINVKDYKLEFLNNKIGYVSQKAILFDGTIKSNIAFYF